MNFEQAFFEELEKIAMKPETKSTLKGLASGALGVGATLGFSHQMGSIGQKVYDSLKYRSAQDRIGHMTSKPAAPKFQSINPTMRLNSLRR